MPDNLIEKALTFLTSLTNLFHAKELGKGDERDRNTEQELISKIAEGQLLIAQIEQTMPDSEGAIKLLKNQMDLYAQQLKEVQARLRK